MKPSITSYTWTPTTTPEMSPVTQGLVLICLGLRLRKWEQFYFTAPLGFPKILSSLYAYLKSQPIVLKNIPVQDHDKIVGPGAHENMGSVVQKLLRIPQQWQYSKAASPGLFLVWPVKPSMSQRQSMPPSAWQSLPERTALCKKERATSIATPAFLWFSSARNTFFQLQSEIRKRKTNTIY